MPVCVTVKVMVSAASFTVTGPIAIVLVSLSVMSTVAVRLAGVGSNVMSGSCAPKVVRFTTTVSVPSTIASLITGTLMSTAVCPARIVTVPLSVV